jgi:hypothetical protein
MGDNGAAGERQDRGTRVFFTSQEALRQLLQPNEQLIGTMLTMFRRRGFMKRCVIGTTPTRMLIVPIRLDGSVKSPPIEISRQDIHGWKADGIVDGIGNRYGVELRIKTPNGTFQINPPIDIGIPVGFDQRCVVDFLIATGMEPG